MKMKMHDKTREDEETDTNQEDSAEKPFGPGARSNLYNDWDKYVNISMLSIINMKTGIVCLLK